MAAPKGNRFWEKKIKLRESELTTNPDKFWDSACEYFKFCEDNPLTEIVFVGKEGRPEEVAKMRAMTIQGLCFFLDISDETFFNLEKKPEFLGIITRIRRVIFTQKFEGAAAGLLNSSIIARELKLAEPVEVKGEIKKPNWLSGSLEVE